MAFTMYLLLVVFALLGAVRAQYGGMEMFSPRFDMGSPALEKRETGCDLDYYPCRDVRDANKCCPKDQYCIVKKNLEVQCCAIGSNCEADTPCSSTAYGCAATITVSGTKTTSVACCGRSCPSTSAYKCAESLGGGCCSYGFDCGPSKGCTSITRPTTSPPIVGVTGTAMSTRTGPGGTIATQAPQGSGGGLSAGAKAGIGVGVAVVALGIIGVLLWFFVAHRRRARQSQKSDSVPARSQGGSEKPVGSKAGGSKTGGSKAGGSKAGSKAGSKKPSVGRTQPSDYFGPTATIGPFTEHNATPATTPGANRGVPAIPQSPGDIATPVEIDSQVQSTRPTPNIDEYATAKGVTEHPVELP